MHHRRAERSYRERVQRVVLFIAAQPLVDHRLEDLAQIANFSPFHFHRIYSTTTGETVSATVRRVRLALAAQLLQEGKCSITEVALLVGYESPQAFTRAFGQFTGQAPRDFRHQLQHVMLNAEQESSDAMPTVQIVERSSQRVYALLHNGPVSTIPHTQRRLRVCAGSRAVDEWLGISSCEPESAFHYRYYAAANTVVPWVDVPAPMERLEIAGGLYARHRLSGPYSRISAAISAVYSRWFPASGYEPDERPTLELYLNSPREVAQADLRTDLLFPIRLATTT